MRRPWHAWNISRVLTVLVGDLVLPNRTSHRSGVCSPVRSLPIVQCIVFVFILSCVVWGKEAVVLEKDG